LGRKKLLGYFFIGMAKIQILTFFFEIPTGTPTTRPSSFKTGEPLEPGEMGAVI
jgi:hypothetical protein